jgi:hypothetical protein
LIATDAFDMAEKPTAEALRSVVTHHMAAITPVLGGAPPVEVQVRAQCGCGCPIMVPGCCSGKRCRSIITTGAWKVMYPLLHRKSAASSVPVVAQGC